MTNKEIKEHKKIIDGMSQREMARIRRFAPAGHDYFNMTLPLDEYFQNRFKELGGFTPALSKSIGW